MLIPSQSPAAPAGNLPKSVPRADDAAAIDLPTTTTTMSDKRVYLFQEGNATMRDLLGGKGANLAEMSNIGLPVPPGFTITTATCNEYYANNRKLPAELMDEVRAAVAAVENDLGKSSEIPATRCSSPFAPAPSSPCPA